MQFLPTGNTLYAVLRFFGLVLLYGCARIVLLTRHPRVIFIVGNVGKTTTKNAVYTMLQRAGISVSRTERSINGFSGVLLTVLRLSPPEKKREWVRVLLDAVRQVCIRGYPDTLVLEVGVDRPKDMRRVVRYIVNPDIVVATAFPPVPVHMSQFSDVEALYYEKGYAFAYVRKSGMIISNGDDVLLQEHIRQRIPSGVSHYTYGIEENSTYTVHGSFPTVEYDEDGRVSGIQFEVTGGGTSAVIFIKNTIGDNALYASLAALTVGLVGYALPLKQTAQTLSSVPFFENGRAALKKGIRNTQVLDDSYNASPYPTERILRTVGEIIVPKRKILVLGDLAELGKKEQEVYRHLIGHVTDLFDEVFLIGDIGAYAPKDGHIHTMKTTEEAVKRVPKAVQEGDFILCKGSRCIGLERVVDVLVR